MAKQEKQTRAKIFARLRQLREQLNEPDADLAAIEAEITQLEEDLNGLADAAGTLADALEEEAVEQGGDAQDGGAGTPEDEQRASTARQRAQLRARIAAGQMGTVARSFAGMDGGAQRAPAYNAQSPEYRSAFFKHLLGRDMTVQERAAFVHTTQNTGAVMPTETLNEIWDLVTGQHCIMGDIRILRTGTTIDVVKHTQVSAGAAKTLEENAANDDEQNVFVSVTLAGKDFSKHIDVSYALERMSIDAFSDYLVSEIANLLGEALSADVVDNAIIAKIAAENKIESATEGAITYKELASTFGLLRRAGAVTVYGTRKTIYTYLVGMEDAQGRPVFQPNANVGAEGYCLGAAVKIEDAVKDGVLLIGDGRKVIYNMVQDIMVETDKDIKHHVTTYAGYARGEGTLIDDTAFATLTVKAGE